MRFALVLLIAGCGLTIAPPERAMPEHSREDRPPNLLVDDYTCDKACKDRIANGITLLSP